MRRANSVANTDRTVTFAEVERDLVEIEHLDDITDHSARWWTPEEEADSRKEYEAVIYLIETDAFVEEKEDSARGLEKRSEQGAWELYEIQRDARNAVLCEQDRQQLSGVTVVEDIAAAYRKVSVNAIEAAQLVAKQDTVAVFDYVRGQAKAKKTSKTQRTKENVRTSPLKSPGKKTVVKWGRKISMPLMSTKKEMELQESLILDPIDLVQATEAATKVLEKKTQKVSTESMNASSKFTDKHVNRKKQTSSKDDAESKPIAKATNAKCTTAGRDKSVKKRQKSTEKQQPQNEGTLVSSSISVLKQESEKATTKRRKSVKKTLDAMAAARATKDSKEALQPEPTKTVSKRRKSVKGKTQGPNSKASSESTDENSKSKTVTKRRKSAKVVDGQEDMTKDKVRTKTVEKRRKSIKQKDTKAQENIIEQVEETCIYFERSAAPRSESRGSKREIDRQEAAKAKETARKLSEGLQKKAAPKKKKPSKANTSSSILRRNPFFKRDASLRSLNDSPGGFETKRQTSFNRKGHASNLAFTRDASLRSLNDSSGGLVMKRQMSFNGKGHESKLDFMLQKHDSFHHSSDLSTKQTQDVSESSSDEEILEEKKPGRRNSPRRIMSGFFPRLRKKTPLIE